MPSRCTRGCACSFSPQRDPGLSPPAVGLRRVPGCEQMLQPGIQCPAFRLKVGLGPTGRSEVDCRMRRRVTAGRWGGRTPQPPNPFVHPLSHVSGGGLRALRGKSPPPPQGGDRPAGPASAPRPAGLPAAADPGPVLPPGGRPRRHRPPDHLPAGLGWRLQPKWLMPKGLERRNPCSRDGGKRPTDPSSGLQQNPQATSNRSPTGLI